MNLKAWIEAMRLRTLPVSVAGVVSGTACATMSGHLQWLPALLCMIFAVLAQIASNFGNEYYDYVGGYDRKGREGFRRGVTEGDLSPKAMKYATYGTLALACGVGCSLIYWGGWWLVPVGICIALFTLAYSTGPWPLSHHGLGDIAVIIFFGIVPVCLTCYVQVQGWWGLHLSLPTGIATGLLAANVLIVNNYRDMEDDSSSGKRTTVVMLGRKTMGRIYYISGWVGMLLLLPMLSIMPLWVSLTCVVYLISHTIVYHRLKRGQGAALNPLLGITAIELLAVSVALLCFALSI